MASKSIAWVHDDALRHWYGDVPAVYVFDDEKLIQQQWSLKRIGFLYECLLDLPLEIRRGNVVAQLLDFQRQHQVENVVTVDTPDPRLRQQITELQALTQLSVTPAASFIQVAGHLDLRRFSKYWSKAEPALFASANLIECPQDK